MCSSFESVCLLCQSATDMIPLTFLLGFYVSIVIGRWSEVFNTMPWIDECDS